MKRFLVTGASGEIGRTVVELLRSQNHTVRVLVRSEEKGRPLAKLGAEVALGDLRDGGSLEAAVKNVTGVYHIGALYRDTGFPESVYHDVNAEGTRRIFEASIAAGVSRLIHCSTGGVLGDVKDPPGSHLTPYKPGDAYQRSKVEGEKIALEYYRSGKMRGSIIRPAMVYGPGDTRHLKLFRMVAQGRFFYVGPGDKSVHFILISDLARAFTLAMEHEERQGEIYHIAGQEPLSLKEAVEIIADRLGVRRPWLHLPVVPMQILGGLCELVCAPFGISPPLYRRRVDFFTKARFFDTSKSAAELGFRPERASREEIAWVAEYFRAAGMLG